MYNSKENNQENIQQNVKNKSSAKGTKRRLDNSVRSFDEKEKISKQLEDIDWNLPIHETLNKSETEQLEDIDWNLPIDETLNDSEIEQFKDQSAFNDFDLIRDISFDFSFDELKDSSNEFINTNKTFYGLPMLVKTLLANERKINELYEWQDTLMNKLINHNENLVYCVPTSGGKTLVAELMILREIILRKRNVLFIFPFISIVQEKVRSLIPFSLEFNFIIEEYAGEKGSIPIKRRKEQNCLYIATIEKAHLILTCLLEERRLEEIGLVVVDELHMLGDHSIRGCTLESLLLLVMLAKHEHFFTARLIAMSATLSNFDEIGKFLNAQIEQRNFRPVELIEFVKFNQKIFKYVGDKEDECFIEHRTLTKSNILTTDPDNLTELVEESMPSSPLLIFCPTKKNCENVVCLLRSHLSEDHKNHKLSERSNILNSLNEASDGSICNVLKIGIPFGIAYHHSGLTTEEREIIEAGFLDGTLNVIVCTSTLAAGVNLPAQRVILRSPYVARDFISSSQYKQMVGRAGRAGFCTSPGESYLMIKDTDDKVNLKSLFVNVENKCTSSIENKKEQGISRIFLSLIHLRLAKNIDEIQDIFLNRSLFGIQFGDNNKEKTTNENKFDFFVMLNKIISKFYNLKLIKEPTSSLDNIKITKLGRGAVKGLIDVKKCANLYADLKKSSSNLSANSRFHLFYICTLIFTEDELPLKPNQVYLQEAFYRLNESEKSDALLMGINEFVVNNYLIGSPATEKIKRFFFALVIYESYKSKTPLHNLSLKCKIQRGTLQQLFYRFSTNSMSLLRFIEELNELWGLRQLLTCICSELSVCANPELLPLLDLPHVKNARAKQLYALGYKTLEDIAEERPYELRKKLDKLSLKAATDMIKYAKQTFNDKVDVLKVEIERYSKLGKSLD